MAATDARPIPRKNAAYRVTFPILDADGDLVTGATGLDSEVSKDGGAFADCTNEATEIATSSGMYFLDLTATEMNADTVAIIVKTSSVGAKTTPIVMYPEEAGDVRVDVVQWSGSAVSALVSGRIDASVGAYQTGLTPLQPTVAGRTLDVTVTGEAGLDFDNTAGTLAKGTDITGFNDLDAAGVRTAVGLAAANLDTQLDAIPTSVENADALLNRDMSTGTDSGSSTVRTPRQALRFLRNKWSISGGSLTVTKEDDSTTSWSGSVTENGAQNAVSSIDPAGP